MSPYHLELTVTATAGATHNIGTLMCLGWVTASTYNPLHRDRGRAAILSRREGGYEALEAHELTVDAGRLGEVVELMRQLGVPERMPQVQARSGIIDGWQEIVLNVTLDSKQGRLTFGMQFAGLEGDDAEPCGAMLTRLFDLLGVGYLGRWVISG